MLKFEVYPGLERDITIADKVRAWCYFSDYGTDPHSLAKRFKLPPSRVIDICRFDDNIVFFIVKGKFISKWMKRMRKDLRLGWKGNYGYRFYEFVGKGDKKYVRISRDSGKIEQMHAYNWCITNLNAFYKFLEL